MYWIGKGILFLRGKKEWQNLGNKGNRVSQNTLLACFFFFENYFHQLLYLGRKVRSPDLRGLWHWLCGRGALCIEDFQMRAFFCIIKPRSCIWFHLSVGIFSIVEHWQHQCFIWSTCLWAGLLRIFGGWKLIVFLSFTIDINTESRSGFSLLDFCCCYSCSHYPLWVNEYPSEAGFFIQVCTSCLVLHPTDSCCT